MPEPSPVGRSLRGTAHPGLLSHRCNVATSQVFDLDRAVRISAPEEPRGFHRVVLSVAICARRAVYSNFELSASHCAFIHHASELALKRLIAGGETKFPVLELIHMWPGSRHATPFGNPSLSGQTSDEAFMMLEALHASILFPRSFEWYPGRRSGGICAQKRVRGMLLCSRRYACTSGRSASIRADTRYHECLQRRGKLVCCAGVDCG